jgi:translation initiation factor eIF-2B subunit delta
VIEMILKQAHDEGKKFRVIIADSHPKFEGKTLMQNLLAHGVQCTYVLINAVAYMMRGVSKVMLGANAMLSNGTCLSRLGSAVVAMAASVNKVPLLICCETYKLSEKVLVDAITFNELSDPDAMCKHDKGVLQDWRDIPKFKLLNLNYDLIPTEFVTMVVTEIGVIPPTSVPVVVREYQEAD